MQKAVIIERDQAVEKLQRNLAEVKKNIIIIEIEIIVIIVIIIMMMVMISTPIIIGNALCEFLRLKG